MLVKLLLAALVVAPVALLAVSALRGRAQVRSCCSLPADQDARMRDVAATAPVPAPPAPSAPSPSSAPSR